MTTLPPRYRQSPERAGNRRPRPQNLGRFDCSDHRRSAIRRVAPMAATADTAAGCWIADPAGAVRRDRQSLSSSRSTRSIAARASSVKTGVTRRVALCLTLLLLLVGVEHCGDALRIGGER